MTSSFNEVPKEAYIDAIQRSAFGLAISNNSYQESPHCAMEMTVPAVVGLNWRIAPHCTPHDVGEILSFVQAHMARRIRPLVSTRESAPGRFVGGRFPMGRYRLDVTGWDVIKSRVSIHGAP